LRKELHEPWQAPRRRAARDLPLLAALLLGLLASSCSQPEATAVVTRGIDNADWTIALYYDADNNLESYMMDDMAELKSAMRDGYPVNIVALIDRGTDTCSDAKVFGEDFQDTRLYEFTVAEPVQIGSGKERDMGSVATLKWLIESVKDQFPARHYALVMGDHGSGLGDLDPYGSRAICYDDTNKSFISVRDFSSGLSADDSIDLLVLDACYMGYAELGYEIAPTRAGLTNAGFTSRYLLASPAEVVAEGFPYDAFLAKLFALYDTSGGSSLTGAELGSVMLDAQGEHLKATYGPGTQDSLARAMCYSLLDLNLIDAFKSKLDALAPALAGRKAEAIPLVFGNAEYATITNPSLFYYFDPSRPKYWLYYPGIDAASLLEQLRSDAGFASLAGPIDSCLQALDDLVLGSLGGEGYSGFSAGRNGLALFFPKGDVKYFSKPVWSYQTWYGPSSLAWSRDGESTVAEVVGNWYQLLDSWWGQ
jgi:clostripain